MVRQPDVERLEERQDADRRREEEALFLLLLALMRQARNRAINAAALGVDPVAAATDVLAGNTALGLAPAWPRIARRLKAADIAGFRRTLRVIGSPDELGGYTLATDYDARARQDVARMLGTLQGRIISGMREAATTGKALRKSIAEAFEAGGYVESATSKAWLLETAAVTLTGFAFNGGWFNGWSRPAVRERIKGFSYSATLDARTTNICRAYDGTRLPVDHPWWQTHWPLCHFNCRSVVLPLFRDFEATEPVWTPWPAVGFGHAPAISAGIRLQPAAA